MGRASLWEADGAGASDKKAWTNISVITAKLERLVSWRQSQNGDQLPQNDEQPLRDELFNVDHLERHAVGLASSHRLTTGRRPDKLIPRLHDNEAILVRTYELVTEATKQKRRIAPAAEWL